MKEHEHPYWLSIHHEGGPRSKNFKEVKSIAQKHGGSEFEYGHLGPEKVTQQHYKMPDDKSTKKATKEVRKKGHMVSGVDY